MGRNTRHLFPALAVSFVLYTRIDHSQGFAFIYIYIYMNMYYISFVFSSKKDTCLIRNQKVYIFHTFFSNCDVFEKGRIFFLFLLTLQTGATETLVFLLGQELVLHLI